MNWIGCIVVVWAVTNPAAPNDRSSPIWKKGGFKTEIECMDALAGQLKRAHETYGNIRTVTILGDCAAKKG
jgi:hypothetical protein